MKSTWWALSIISLALLSHYETRFYAGFVRWLPPMVIWVTLAVWYAREKP